MEEVNEKAELEWSEPPPDKRGAPALFWQEVWRQLRERPGEWAKLPGTYPSSVPTNIKNGAYAGTVKGEFGCTTRGAEKLPGKKSRRCHIWVRYEGVPEPDEA